MTYFASTLTRYRNGWELNPKSKRGNNNPQQDKRGRTNTARPFFLRIVRKGKRKHKPHNDTRTNKAGKRTSRGQEDKQGKQEKR